MKSLHPVFRCLYGAAFFFVSLLVAVPVAAQQQNGTTGLIHIPTAETNPAGEVRVGAHFVNKVFVPDATYFTAPDDEGNPQKYNTGSYYFSIAPFSWLEVGYTCVMFKYNKPGNVGYNAKDRHFSIKVRPLKEGRYWPAVAIGTDDFINSSFSTEAGNSFYGNYWISACKHFDLHGHELAAHLGYRYYTRDYNKKYQGVNGAVTYRPRFAPYTRAIVEWDGTHCNLGVDALLWQHFLLQFSLTDGSKPSFGLAFQMNLRRCEPFRFK